MVTYPCGRLNVWLETNLRYQTMFGSQLSSGFGRGILFWRLYRRRVDSGGTFASRRKCITSKVSVSTVGSICCANRFAQCRKHVLVLLGEISEKRSKTILVVLVEGFWQWWLGWFWREDVKYAWGQSEIVLYRSKFLSRLVGGSRAGGGIPRG